MALTPQVLMRIFHCSISRPAVLILVYLQYPCTQQHVITSHPPLHQGQMFSQLWVWFWGLQAWTLGHGDLLQGVSSMNLPHHEVWGLRAAWGNHTCSPSGSFQTTISLTDARSHVTTCGNLVWAQEGEPSSTQLKSRVEPRSSLT